MFQAHYALLPEFQNNKNIPIIGTLATGIQFLGAPLMRPLVMKFHQWQRRMVILGSSICILSVLGASFVHSINGLIITQGVLYGCGFLLLYFPFLCMLNEWFVQRRGLAYGVVFAGGGFSGLCLPFLFEWLLSRYGYHTTLRVVAILQLVTIGPVLFLLKRRLPSSQRTAIRAADLTFLRQPLFWILMLSNVCQSFAYYVPSLYLPTYASALGLSGTLGALVLAVNNLATIFGQIGFGYASDRFSNIYILILISTVVASAAAFGLWGFAHSMSVLTIFSFLYGTFAGGYVVFWPRFGTMVSEDMQSVYSLMSFGKGIGSVATGPITAKLLTQSVTSGYGLGRFQLLILYSGIAMLCSSIGVTGRLFNRRVARV